MSATERQEHAQVASRRVVVARDTRYLLLEPKGAGNFGELWKAAALAARYDQLRVCATVAFGEAAPAR